MRAYLNYFKLRIITNLQYRSAAIAGILTQLFFAGLFIMLYIALYESKRGGKNKVTRFVPKLPTIIEPEEGLGLRR